MYAIISNCLLKNLIICFPDIICFPESSKITQHSDYDAQINSLGLSVKMLDVNPDASRGSKS